jgi:ubiquinone/menaquinone biosynthesis C-methylase UbiE
MKGKSILETGCGKAGGLLHLTNTLKPAEVTAIDISPLSVISFFLKAIYDVID